MPRGQGKGKDFTVTIEHSNGKTFPEYMVTHDQTNNNQTEFAIESQPSKRFNISIIDNVPSNRKNKKHVMAQLKFDIPGARDDLVAFYKKGNKPASDALIKEVTMRSEKGEGDVKLVFPAEKATSGQEEANMVRQILIQMWYGPMECPCMHEPRGALSKSTSVGKPKNVPLPNCKHNASIEYDEDEPPFYTFIIKYGSKTALSRTEPIDTGEVKLPVASLPNTPQSLPATPTVAGSSRKRPREVSPVKSVKVATADEIEVCERRLRMYQKQKIEDRMDLQTATEMLRTAEDENMSAERITKHRSILKNAEDSVNVTEDLIQETTERLESLKASQKQAGGQIDLTELSDDEDLGVVARTNLGRLTRSGREKAKNQSY